MNDLEEKWKMALLKVEKQFGDKISLKGNLVFNRSSRA